MGVKYSNYFRTTISDSGGITASDVQITLTSAEGLPSLGVGDWTYLVLVNLVRGVKEIVKVTGISGSVVTVERGKDGTNAIAFDQYDLVEMWITKALLDDGFDAANADATAIANDARAAADQAVIDAASATATAEAAQVTADAATVAASAAQSTADLAAPLAGATITGDLVVQGTLTAEGAVSGFNNDRVGDLIERLGPTAPGGTLACDGTQYDAVTTPAYLDLFNHLLAINESAFIIENTASAKRFVVPDMRGLVLVGAGQHTDGNGETQTVEGQAEIGEFSHALVLNEIPSHNHTLSLPVFAWNAAPSIDLIGDGSADDKFAITTKLATNNSGGGLVHNNIQPSYGVYRFIVYSG